ncbi:MAG: NAD(P)-binding protein [Rhodospirillales bacterium]|nr:NAD(P)-binding protein [Rhodospirillales bacterium]
MSQQPADLTRPPDLSVKRPTAHTRSQRPVYLDLLPPCNNACPAGEDIQTWLAHATAGRFREAWETILRDNPMPAVHGRVCYHPCESNCNRGQLDSPVSIHAVERFLGDKALEEGWTPTITATPTGKRILVVGAGPSGLSCAHHLALMGHSVEVRDAGPIAGGMMHFGIPSYRLPRNILDGEVARIERMGVKFVLNHKVEDLVAAKTEGKFDAVFVAVGAHLSKKTEIPARDAGKILDAVSFLKDVEMGNAPKLGRKVAIYGGGNTAMDAARVAMRLGHEPMIIYRRDRAHMPAHEFEADEALEEGVMIHWLRTIKSVDATSVTVEVMELDEKGRPRPTGQIETIEANDLILALGQDTDTAFLHKVPGVQFKDDGTVIVSEQMMTGYAGLFAGGDMVPSERTVTIGVGHGKKAARNIDAFLRGEGFIKPPKKDLADFEKLHLWFYTGVEQRPQGHVEMQKRRTSFDEVVHGLGEKEAVYEAKRCLSCGNCFECDGCYGACPEDAVIKLGPGNRYQYNYDLCTGCAVCFEQCPCHAITMIPEPNPVV